jgi:hypothetical protein
MKEASQVLAVAVDDGEPEGATEVTTCSGSGNRMVAAAV